MAEEKKFYKTHFTVPELPWKKDEKMEEETKEEKIFLVTFGWGNSWNCENCLIKSKDKDDAEEKAKRIFNGAYINIIYVNELEFDSEGVYYL